jgi:ABC-type phosphate transport system substrate-binding protein
MNVELRKPQMANTRRHYSLPEFLISRWKRPDESGTQEITNGQYAQTHLPALVP